MMDIKVGDTTRQFDLDDPQLPDWVSDNALTSANYAYDKKLKRSKYEAQLDVLHLELVKLQAHRLNTGQRMIIVFEGRDAAGKGGTIGAFREFLKARHAKVVALSKPTEAEQGQWYFQRYVCHFPTDGDMTMFDRSWYNRGGVEPVMGFCSPQQNEHFLQQVPAFEKQVGFRPFREKHHPAVPMRTVADSQALHDFDVGLAFSGLRIGVQPKGQVEIVQKPKAVGKTAHDNRIAVQKHRSFKRADFVYRGFDGPVPRLTFLQHDNGVGRIQQIDLRRFHRAIGHKAHRQTRVCFPKASNRAQRHRQIWCPKRKVYDPTPLHPPVIHVLFPHALWRPRQPIKSPASSISKIAGGPRRLMNCKTSQCKSIVRNPEKIG